VDTEREEPAQGPASYLAQSGPIHWSAAQETRQFRRFDYQPHSSPEEPRDALGTPKPVPKTCPHSAASSGIQDLALSKTQRA
jgi:hypothetical protein